MSNIHLIHQDGFEWKSHGHVTFKGYIYDKHGCFLPANMAVSFFSNITSKKKLLYLLQAIDGAFTLIIKIDGGMLIATDPMGMFPLLYTKVSGKWHIADNIEHLLRHKENCRLNASALPEFHASGFILDKETLIEGIFRTRPGEVLWLKDPDEVSTKIYHFFLPDFFTTDPAAQLRQKLNQVLDHMTDRLVSSLDGKTAVIPLSGGFDSRLIACMLKKAHYHNTICLTYGRPNQESRLSEKVARALGFRWIFVDYREIDPTTFLNDSVFKMYSDYAGMASSMPYLQEYFAIKYITDNQLIPPDSIFLPGHTGDFIAGSYTEKTIRTKITCLADPEILVDKYFRFIHLTDDQKRIIGSRLRRWFKAYEPPSAATSDKYDIFIEDWDLKEKISKFVFNSTKVFPYFGYQYRLPLWDRAFRLFFRKLPFKYRSNKALYDAVLTNDYFRPMGVSFDGEEIKLSFWGQKMQGAKALISHYLPGSIRMKRMKARDYICYHKFTAEMLHSLEDKGIETSLNVNSYNAFICLWYSNEVQSKI